MSALRIIAAITLADLRQRLRAPRTRVLMAVLAAASWWSFPPIEADYLTVWFAEGARARYASAWVGLVIASIYGALLSLAGFYIVRGTVVRDLRLAVAGGHADEPHGLFTGQVPLALTVLVLAWRPLVARAR